MIDDLTKKMDCGLDGLARLEVILSDAREKGIGTHQADLITKAAASVECLTKAQNAKANNSAEAAAAACAMAGEHSLGAAVKEACEQVRTNIEKLGGVADALAAALEAKDVDAIKAAYDEAKELGLADDKMDQAATIVERDTIVAETMSKLGAATEGLNLVDLNANSEKALELGMDGDVVDAAKAALKAAQAKHDTLGKVFATVKSRTVKMEDTCGVTESDLAPLRDAISEVRFLLFTVTFYANHAHNLTRSP